MRSFKIALWALLLPCLLPAQQTPEIKDIALFLHDRVEILDFAGPMEVFIAAGFNVYTVSETKAPIKAMGELTILPDYDLNDCPVPDIVAFFGGGGASRVAQRAEVQAWMAKVFPQTDLQFSVCTGAFFLGEMGLLDGQTATTFHSAIPSLREKFPKAEVRDDVRFVDNGRVITTAGISAGIDGALHLVAKLKGMETAVSVAENMEYTGWEPEKGLVLPSPAIQAIREKGLKAGLKKAGPDALLFSGELMDLGREYAKAQQLDKALEIFGFALENMSLPYEDCETIREAMLAAEQEAPPSRKVLLEKFDQGAYADVAEIIQETKKQYPNWSFFSERWTNGYGYHLMAEGQLEKAIELFKLNVLAYPQSFNTYDSLGEAYMKAEQWDLAVKNYNRSLELNPDNGNGREMLEKIELQRPRKQIEE